MICDAVVASPADAFPAAAEFTCLCAATKEFLPPRSFFVAEHPWLKRRARAGADMGGETPRVGCRRFASGRTALSLLACATGVGLFRLAFS